MSLIQIYRGDAKTLSLNFANEDGTPYNVSGSIATFVAAASYTESPIMTISATGNSAAAVTGLLVIPITSGDSNHCPGNYLAEVRFIDSSGSPSTFQTEGLSILPTILP